MNIPTTAFRWRDDFSNMNKLTVVDPDSDDNNLNRKLTHDKIEMVDRRDVIEAINEARSIEQLKEHIVETKTETETPNWIRENPDGTTTIIET
jgi:hypothetical protein